ncbi:MAG: hypothetical protein JO244_15450, partial [Solirubrobacterales bacterium]|nr:hypothetical protein [Solirubrobacterales bacterium]
MPRPIVQRLIAQPLHPLGTDIHHRLLHRQRLIPLLARRDQFQPLGQLGADLGQRLLQVRVPLLHRVQPGEQRLQPALELADGHLLGTVVLEDRGGLRRVELARSVQAREIVEVELEHKPIGEQVAGPPAEQVQRVNPLRRMETPAGLELLLQDRDLLQQPVNPQREVAELEVDPRRIVGEPRDQLLDLKRLGAVVAVLETVDGPRHGGVLGASAAEHPPLGVHGVGDLGALGLGLGPQITAPALDHAFQQRRVLAGQDQGLGAGQAMSRMIELRPVLARGRPWAGAPLGVAP